MSELCAQSSSMVCGKKRKLNVRHGLLERHSNSIYRHFLQGKPHKSSVQVSHAAFEEFGFQKTLILQSFCSLGSAFILSK